MTSAHVFEGDTEATLWINGNRHEATVLKADKAVALALLRINEMPEELIAPLTPVAAEDYRLGGEVFTIGFPLSDILGRSPRLNKGLISATVGMKGDPAFIQVSVETQPGNSGSPVFNANREVTGLIQSTLNAAQMMQATGGAAPQNVNFALKLASIQTFLEGTDVIWQSRGTMEEGADFEVLSRSVAHVRSGIVTEEMLDTDKLIGLVAYDSFWDMWRRFRFFHIIFVDFQTRDIVLTAGQTGDNPLSSENSTIRSTLDEVQRKLGPKEGPGVTTGVGPQNIN